MPQQACCVALSLLVWAQLRPGPCRALRDSLTGNEGKGFIKVVVNAQTDKVLGIHLVGPEVAEILQVAYSHFVYCPCCVQAGALWQCCTPVAKQFPTYADEAAHVHIS